MEPTGTAIAYPELGIELRSYRGLVQPFAAHSHDACVIGFVEEGTRDMVCDGTPSRIAPGDLLVFNPGDVHACAQHDVAPFAYTSLVVEPLALGPARLQGPVVHDKSVVRSFSMLVESLKRENLGGAAEASRRLRELLIILRSRASDEHDATAHPTIAECAQRSLRASFAKRRSLDGLASEQGISKYQLLRAYKKRYGITPFAHLASFKVERARDLLASGMTPGKVATQAGFADQAHLTRVFKQQIGMTPKAYQRMIVEEAGANR